MHSIISHFEPRSHYWSTRLALHRPFASQSYRYSLISIRAFRISRTLESRHGRIAHPNHYNTSAITIRNTNSHLPNMPADYNSTAQALALSPDRGSSPSSNRPPWSTTSSSRRMSNPLINRRRASSGYAAGRKSSFVHRIWSSVNLLGEQVFKVYLRLSPVQRVLALAGVVAAGVLGVLAIIYSHVFFKWLEPKAEAWRALPGGWILAFMLVFVTSFPPIVGYSTASTIAGFVYGFPLGWPIVASGCTAGALCAFLASRTVLSGYVDRMVGRDHRFVALGQVLRQEGIWYLTAIRFCPLPFSLSNGFLATIPSITPLAFTISTALSRYVYAQHAPHIKVLCADKSIAPSCLSMFSSAVVLLS